MTLTRQPESAEDTIRRVAADLGIDPNLAVATAKHESGLNPNAVGDAGCSVGLFQLNTCGGEGVGLSQAQLVDPEINARRALSQFARVQKANPELVGGELAAAAQRPADPEGYAKKVNALWAAMGGSGPTEPPKPPEPPSGGFGLLQPLPLAQPIGGGGYVTPSVAENIAAGKTTSGGAPISLTTIMVPGFEQVGVFFEKLGGIFKPENWWRAAFLLGGGAAIIIGGRMYMSEEGVPA